MPKKPVTEDRRVRRTKRHFKRAFLELLYEKSIEDISVTDIVEKADYNRSTFYFHYNYKEEMIVELNQSLLNGLLNSIFTTKKRKKKISSSDIAVFNYILSKKEYFMLWKNPEVLCGLEDEFIEQLTHLFVDKLYFSTDKQPAFLEYKTTFLAHGILNIILQWIKDDFKEDPKDMARLVSELINSISHSST